MKKPVNCQSCRFKGTIDVKKGQKVKNIKCPGCGKATLR